MSFLLEVPAIKNRITKPLVVQEWAREENRVKQVRQDVERAREDVTTLLEELDRASDKVVSLITGYVGQAQEAQSQLKPSTKAPVEPPNSKNLTTEPISNTKTSKKPADSKYQSVYELAAKGMPVDDIAQLTKIGKGEVELLLELKNRGGNW